MRTIAVICVIAASVFVVPSAWAGLVGDEYQHDPYFDHDQWQTAYNISYGVGGSTLVAQTFTAGQTGILDHIDIGNLTGVTYYPVSPSPVVEIRGSQPDSATLASVTLSSPLLLDNWTLCIEPLDSSGQKISVEAGTMYSIVLSTVDQPMTATVGATINNSYDGGELWAWGDWDWDDNPETTFYEWAQLSRTGISDMQFQTYVVPVPLPAGVWLGICAVGAAGWHLKRQRG